MRKQLAAGYDLHDDEHKTLVLERPLHRHDERVRDLRHQVALAVDVVHLWAGNVFHEIQR